MKKLKSAALAAAAGWLLVTNPAAHAEDMQPAAGTTIEIYTDADASAVLNARIAALKTVLDLTSEQQKLWPPVEGAIRSIASAAMARGKQRSEAAAPTDFLEVIERIGDAEATRAADLKSFVAAARPLVASLSDAQKNRMPGFLGMVGTATAPLSSESFWLFEEEER
ncbi:MULTISPECIES: Spy/CpxP family protein refolding chaperone [unclassified Chelatococcus]|uniref:Spy/CpxP family protein refolding chaperone n=1 Tax=unclassified Chelatococcus TaxID=2638111 RepID=UPI001BCDF789|nr:MULTISPECIES: Spy/CpxP family protein refolding chaperone [unclassified Chelatococcus]MBS7701562.1 Spy/CpxP family protein refolding chaperone [Chelatococcus sp. YT9]MBX3557397.1 Spy/CpxP family protein refolding chaperone [Chelatococcus sp.]